MHDEDFSAIMVLDPLHRQALKRAYEILGPANMLHADSMFDGEESADRVLLNCFNPARAAADAMLTGGGIVSVVDSNFVSGCAVFWRPSRALRLPKKTKRLFHFSYFPPCAMVR